MTPAQAEQIRIFSTLPDESFVDVKAVAAIRGTSIATAWEHARKGLIPAPVKLSEKATRWHTGQLRAAMGLRGAAQ